MMPVSNYRQACPFCPGKRVYNNIVGAAKEGVFAVNVKNARLMLKKFYMRLLIGKTGLAYM